MPTYLFHNTTTHEEWEEMMGISEAEKYLGLNPHIERRPNGAPVISEPMLQGMKKPDEGFRELLRNMKKHHRNSTVNTF